MGSNKVQNTMFDPAQNIGYDPIKNLVSDMVKNPASDSDNCLHDVHGKTATSSNDIDNVDNDNEQLPENIIPHQEPDNINTSIAQQISPSPTSDEESSSFESESSEDSGNNAQPPLTRHQKITLLSLVISCILDNASFSILLPFFPIEAAKKGVSVHLIGFIFGVYALVQFILSPIFGKYMPVVGAKFMFLAGLFVTGGCNLIFGILSELPDGQAFTVCCFIVRISEAIGTAAGLTALYAVVAITFPARVALMIGMIEAADEIGLMLGPPAGGFLYQIGGYQLPFVCLGVSVILSAIVNIYLLPSQDTKQNKTGSLRQVLSVVPIWPVLIALFIESTGIGFLEPTLAPHLQQFDMTPTSIGGFLFISSGVCGLMSPLVGYVVDNKDVTRIMMILGFYITGLGFLLLGPSTLLKLPNELWIVGLGLGLIGMGWGCNMVPPYKDMISSAVCYGLPDNVETQGIIAGLQLSIFSLGCFVGPTIAGIMIDKFGFNLSVTIYACVCFIVTIGLGLFCCWEYQCGIGRRKPNRNLTSALRKDDNEVKPLLSRNKTTNKLKTPVGDFTSRFKSLCDKLNGNNSHVSKNDRLLHMDKVNPNTP